jgi:ABC-type nickel/cobalt efflux system permease component RcnA
MSTLINRLQMMFRRSRLRRGFYALTGVMIVLAIALSTIGILAILGRQTIDRQFNNSARQQAIAAGLRFVGAALVFMVGSSLFMLTLTSTVES